MDKFFADLFSNPLPLKTDAIVVYFILRSDISRNETVTARTLKGDGKLVSGLDVPTIALRAGSSELSVFSSLSVLKAAGWVQAHGDFFQLGTKAEFEVCWFAEKEKAEAPPDSDAVVQIRRLADDQKKKRLSERPKKLSQKAQQKIAAESLGGLVRPEKASTIILSYLESHIKEKFGVSLEYDHRTKYVYAGRIVSWCDEDIDAAKALILWTIANWDALKNVLRSSEDTPTLNLFATKSIFNSISKYMVAGIPKPKSITKIDKTGMATRADTEKIEDAKDEGW